MNVLKKIDTSCSLEYVEGTSKEGKPYKGYRISFPRDLELPSLFIDTKNFAGREIAAFVKYKGIAVGGKE